MSYVSSGKGELINAISLNDILKGRKNVMVKCDVDGAEDEIFCDSANLNNVSRLIVEYHKHESSAKLTKTLIAKGFEIVEIKPEKGVDGIGTIYSRKINR